MEYSNYLFFDKPIPYKELKLYPILVNEYLDFNILISCLLIEKNAIPDIQVISMSYLQFIFFLSDNGNNIPITQFRFLLSMVLHRNVNDIGLIRDNNVPYFVIDDIRYGADDLLEIKKIIFLQNDIDDIDENIQKELRDKLREAEMMKAKLSGSNPGSFEDRIMCLMCALPGISLESIYEMPLRKFNKALKRADYMLDYKINKTAERSGNVTFKEPIRHWMTNLDDSDKYKDVTMDVEQLQSKINMER